MRADLYLYKFSHTKSRQSAKALIEKGCVKVDGNVIPKPSFEIGADEEHIVEFSEKPRFVSRGGEKLEAAIEAFGIDVSGLYAIDIGASTGGFTHCLLQRGAESVYAVDSGCGQLDPLIAGDSRVISIEKYNARYMKKSDFPHEFSIAVADVSFISQTYIHRAIYDVLSEEGAFVSLIKPQFECGRQALGKGGIVVKGSDRAKAVKRVFDSAVSNGFSIIDLIRSPIEGGSGNIEFLAYFVKSKDPECLVSEKKIKGLSL